jgi:hypothetical protein
VRPLPHGKTKTRAGLDSNMHRVGKTAGRVGHQSLTAVGPLSRMMVIYLLNLNVGSDSEQTHTETTHTHTHTQINKNK